MSIAISLSPRNRVTAPAAKAAGLFSGVNATPAPENKQRLSAVIATISRCEYSQVAHGRDRAVPPATIKSSS
jgi:hypothetical protein